MKKLVIFVIVIGVLALPSPALACTSFAFYGGDTPVYGMNFDYTPVAVRLSIEESGGPAYFSMQFAQGGRFSSTAGMNEDGLFTTLQMQFPELSGQDDCSIDELLVPEIYDCVGRYATVDDVLGFLEGKRLRQWSGVTLHSLLADATGSAVIAEAGDEENEFTPIDGDYIVMTNFKNADYRDVPYDEAVGIGADRYVTAWEYIRDHRDDFGVEQALECLRSAAQGGDYATRCSMVCVPGESAVYVALERDFDHIWKISIPERSIETYRGYGESMKFMIPGDGVPASALMDGDYAGLTPYEEAEPASAGEAPANQGLLIAALILAAVVIVASGVTMQKRRRARER